jgi:branched-chain amino acid transport system permease protein
VAFYWLTLVLCVGGALLLRRALYAPFGYALRAGRDSALRAEAIGLNVPRLRLAAFALAGAAAGLAGGVFAYAKGSVFPGYSSIPHSIDALVMVLLGGVQTMAGPIVGALAYTGLYTVLLRATDAWRFVLGIAIVVLVLAFPEGIAGASQRLFRRRRPA